MHLELLVEKILVEVILNLYIIDYTNIQELIVASNQKVNNQPLNQESKIRNQNRRYFNRFNIGKV
jgi:hypothetical protein